MTTPPTSRSDCVCCGFPVMPRDPDPWDGRLDVYCQECALARCDAYPGYCPNEGRLYSDRIAQVIAEGLVRADSVLVIDCGPNDADSWNRFLWAARDVLGRLDRAGFQVTSKRPQNPTGTGSTTLYVKADDDEASA